MDLNFQQLKAITLLAEGQPASKVAKSLKIAQRTLFTWRQLPEFRTALSEAKSEMYEEAIGRLRTSAKTASEILLEIAQDKSVSAAARVRSCEIILSHSKLETLDQIEEVKAIKTLSESRLLSSQATDRIEQSLQFFHKQVREALNGETSETGTSS
jgi:uncharacterized protein (UPF0147 family)